MPGAQTHEYWYTALIAVGYGLMLPAIAVLHPRHTAVRQSGAYLGTIAGIAVVTVGLGGSVDTDLRPAALLVLGIWWWTMGKMWVQTAVMSRRMGLATAAFGVIAILGAFLVGPLAIDVWTALQVALGGWLLALAVFLNRLG